MFTQQQPQELARDSKGRFFLDRDGFLFRYILDYLRDLQLVLPDYFPERSRLQREAEYFELPERYTSRYYLKFNFLEQAFDKLSESGFHMVACSSTGTCAFASSTDQSEDKIWTSYTEIICVYTCCFSGEMYDVPIPRDNWQCLQRGLISMAVSMECSYYVKAMYYEALINF